MFIVQATGKKDKDIFEFFVFSFLVINSKLLAASSLAAKLGKKSLAALDLNTVILTLSLSLSLFVVCFFLSCF
jgi:hypothetical protein